MRKFVGSVLFFVFFGFYSAFGQSSCGCENYGCSVSQSCPSGYIASCACTAQGCSGQCNKATDLVLDFATGRQSLIGAIAESNEKSISMEFSKNLGKKVVFTKGSNAQSLEIAQQSFKSYWEIAEFLAASGKITINGLPFEIWKGHRDILLNGGPYNICANDAPAQMILNEINFVTGRSFQIVTGDSKSTAKAPIRGNNLKEVLESLSASRDIKISEIEKGGVDGH